MMDIPTDEELLGSIDRFRERHAMAETRFGAMATGEPQLLSSIRGGRSPSLKLLRKLKAFMDRVDAEAPDHAGTVTAATAARSSGNAVKVSARAGAA